MFTKGNVPAKKSKVAAALSKVPTPSAAIRPATGIEDPGMGAQPLLKNSKVYNRLKELKGQ